MKLLSFAWTTAALLAERKSVTRRGWAPEVARLWRAGDLVQAWDRRPSFGGMRVATLKLVKDAVASREFPEGDWEAEGFGYLEAMGLGCGKVSPRAMWEGWLAERPELVVVRFEVEELWMGVDEWMEARAERDAARRRARADGTGKAGGKR